MNQLTEEQRERVKQIRERKDALNLRHGDWPCQIVHNNRERAFQQYVLADIDFLLSLIDSQAAEDRPRPLPKWFVCIDPDEIPLVIALLRGSGEAKENEAAKIHLVLCAHCKELVDATATAMRDACVEKVKAMREQHTHDYEYWKAVSSHPDTDFGVLKFAAWAGEDDRVIDALESLTLDQVQEKQ